MRKRTGEAGGERILPKAERRERTEVQLRLRRSGCAWPVANRNALNRPAPVCGDVDTHGPVLACRGHVAALIRNEYRAAAAGPIPVVGILAVILALVVGDDDKLRTQQLEQLSAATAFSAVMRGDEHRDVVDVLAEGWDRE